MDEAPEEASEKRIGHEQICQYIRTTVQMVGNFHNFGRQLLSVGILGLIFHWKVIWAVLVLLIFPSLLTAICPSLLTAKGYPNIYLHFRVLSHHLGLHFKLTTYGQ